MRFVGIGHCSQCIIVGASKALNRALALARVSPKSRKGGEVTLELFTVEENEPLLEFTATVAFSNRFEGWVYVLSSLLVLLVCGMFLLNNPSCLEQFKTTQSNTVRLMKAISR